jgi:predicted flap endonuclease-1-like 5' DNA nuclease
VADDPPKSAFELAMERLRKKDEEAGVEERRLTDDQRAAIAGVRKVYEARLAEREILHRSKLAETADPEARARLEDEYRRDRERIVSDRDRKLDEARRQG